MSELVEDRLSRGMPHEWFGSGIGGSEVCLDCRYQLGDAIEATAPYAFFCEVPEPPFNKIQPRGTGGGEMHMESCMPIQPLLYLDLAVSPVVVHYQVQGNMLRELSIQLAQETQKLLVTMSGEALSYDPSVQEVEGCEECGGPMPLVVMGHGPATSLLDGQPGLSALQGLNLTLFVHTKDNRLIGRIQIQSHHICELLSEVRVLGELEPLGSVGLKPMSAPYPLYSGIADALGFSHSACAPVSSAFGLSLRCQPHDFGDSLGVVQTRPPASALDPGQVLDTSSLETLTPQDYRRAGGPQFRRNAVIGDAIGSPEDNPCAESNTLGSTWSPAPRFKNSPLFTRYGQRIDCIPHANYHEPSVAHCQVIYETVD